MSLQEQLSDLELASTVWRYTTAPIEQVDDTTQHGSTASHQTFFGYGRDVRCPLC